MHAAPVHPIIRIIQNHSHHSLTLAFHIHPCHNMTQKANARRGQKPRECEPFRGMPEISRLPQGGDAGLGV